MTQFLVAAVDGEMVCFAVARKSTSASLTLDHQWKGKTADYPTFIDALQNYLKQHELQPRDYPFSVAVAGVPRGDIISLANCRWMISVTGLRAFLRSEPLILNDFAATAWSLTGLDRTHLMNVGTHTPRPLAPSSTYLCVGTGIGLGVAALRTTGAGEVVVLESEGGHSSFAPQSDVDDLILAHLRRRYGHVSYERLLSEPGLQNIYGALSQRDGKTTPPPAPAAIIASARHRADPLAVETLSIFASTLGSFIGSTALTVGSWDGVFLTGDMLRELVPTLTKGEFRKMLTSKGRASKVLEKIPISCVTHVETRLLGAAAALAARTPASSVAEPALAVGAA